MANAVKLRETAYHVNGAAKKGEAQRKKKDAAAEAKGNFQDKTFATLTNKEKDDLLKYMAIAAGFISE